MATRRTTRSPELPPPATLRRLKLSAEVAHYLATRGVPLPDCPPLLKTPEPRRLSSARFDPGRVDRVLAALARLRHTKGRWAGSPLRPDPWQVAYVIAPVFGWVRPHSSGVWVRVIASAYVEVPRRNGKTTLSGGLAMYLAAADGEPGAEVYTLAAGKDQARRTFDPVKQVAERSPALRRHVRVLADKIVHGRSGSYLQVVSSVADLMHGGNVHGATIDELHVHKTADLVETVESGTGSRLQPLVIIITTSGDGKPGTIYERKRRYVEQLAERVITDESTYGVIFAAASSEQALADAGLSPFEEQTWRKANPGYGVSPSAEYLRRAAKRASNSPADLASFLRLSLGIRTRQTTKYISLGAWDATAGMVSEERLEGRACHGGLDLSSVADLTALCWHFGPADDGGEHQVLWRFWLPSERLPDLDRRTAGQASVWVREGRLQLTEGNVIDNDAVVAAVLADAERFEVATVGYDRWGATDVVRRLGDEGLTCVGVGQGFASLSAPLKELLRLVLGSQYRHGGNPVMRWMVSNLAVRNDPAGNVKPDKASSADKIDGVSAAVVALKEHMDALLEAESYPEADIW